MLSFPRTKWSINPYNLKINPRLSTPFVNLLLSGCLIITTTNIPPHLITLSASSIVLHITYLPHAPLQDLDGSKFAEEHVRILLRATKGTVITDGANVVVDARQPYRARFYDLVQRRAAVAEAHYVNNFEVCSFVFLFPNYYSRDNNNHHHRRQRNTRRKFTASWRSSLPKRAAQCCI
jgi:hypothetical protein